MKDNIDIFPPEYIDEQTTRASNSLSAEDAHLVEDIYTHYQSYAQANIHSLTYVWQQLEERQKPRPHQDNQKQPLSLSTSYHNDTPIHFTSSSTDKIKRWQSLLGTIAAVLCLTLIVGSMILVLNTIHHNKNAQHGHGSKSFSSVSTPTLSSKGIYISSQKDRSSLQISKLDAKTHEPVWTHDAAALGSFIIVDDTIYFNASDANSYLPDNYIYALNALDGSQRWKTDLSSDVTYPDPKYGGPFDLSYLTTPVVMNKTVYTLRRDGRIFALDIKDGHLLWTYDMHQSAFVDGTIYDGGLTAANGIVYANLHNELIAINAQNKTQIWVTTIATTQIITAPTVSGNTVYISSFSESEHNAGQTMTSGVYAFDAKSGANRWAFPVDGWLISTPTIMYGMVYFGSFNHNVYALRVSDGKPVWIYDTKGHADASPLVTNGILYTMEAGNWTISGGGDNNTIQPALITLNASTGALIWQKEASTSESAPQVIQGGVLYTSVFPRLLIAYDATTGKQLWQHLYGAKLIDKTGQESGAAPIVVVNP